MSNVAAPKEHIKQTSDQQEAYVESLLVNARHFFDIGLHPVPYRYNGSSRTTPKKYWLKTRFKNWKDIQQEFFSMYLADGSTRKISPYALGINLRHTNVAVLDIDEPKLAEWWLKHASEEALSLPRARTRRGLHVYCIFEETPKATISKKTLGWGGELLAGDQLVIAPPSLHVNKIARYQWETTKYSLKDLHSPIALEALIPDADVVARLRSAVRSTLKSSRKIFQSIPVGVAAPAYENRPCLPLGNTLNANPCVTPGAPVNTGGIMCPVTQPGAWRKLERKWLKRAIEMTLPKEKGYRVEMLGSFTHLLRRNLGDEAPMEQIRMCGKAWWDTAHRMGRTSETDAYRTMEAVEDYWHNHDPSKRTFLRELRVTVENMESAFDASEILDELKKDSDNRRQATPYLIKLLQALHLASAHKGGDFFISLRDAATASFPPELLEKKDNHKFVDGVFKAMERAGWLRCTRRGTSGVRKGGRASDYLWLGPEWDGGAIISRVDSVGDLDRSVSYEDSYSA